VITIGLTISAEAVEAIATRTAEIVLQAGIAGISTPWMNRSQAADYLGYPLSRLEKDRNIPCHRDNGRVLYHRAELDAHFLGLGR
jgi:hypothetical protein